MLLNLTNHPSKLWQTAQLEAAQKYGDIVDMPFPQIQPDDSILHICKLADQYVQQICNLQPKAVHLMGEMTFTYQLVKRLAQHNILCLASTTHRNTVVKDGVKNVDFQFVQFRPYTL